MASIQQLQVSSQVGFIGLGQMGSRMARNLKHGGHDLLVYDNSTTRLRDFCKDTGIPSAASPSAMAAEAGVWRLRAFQTKALHAAAVLNEDVSHLRRCNFHNVAQLQAC